MPSEPQSTIVPKVIPIGTGGSDGVEVLRPSLEAIFSDVSIEPVRESGFEEAVSSLRDGQPEDCTTVAIVCTASQFCSKYVDETVAQLSNVRLLVVDVDASHDPAEIQMHPHITYIHAESPREQILATLQAALPAADGDTGTVPDTYTASETELLPASNPSLRRLFVEAPLPLLAAEAESGTVVAANDRACEILGQPRESLLGTTQEKLHPEGTDTDYRDGFEESIDTGGADSYAQYDDPLYIETDDGEKIPVDIIDTTVKDDGRTYLLGAFLDVSDRVEEQAALRRRSVAIEASLTGISILDPDGTYVYMNEAHADLFGYEPEDLLGESWRTLYDEATQAKIEAGPFEDLERTGSWEGELTGIRRDETPVEHYVSLTRLPDGGIVCVNRDIGDRKRFERQLESVRNAARSFMLAADRDTILDRGVEVITETLDRPIAGYCRYDAADDQLEPVSVSPRSRELFDGLPIFRRGEGLVWRAFETGEIQYYPDLGNLDGVYNPDTPIRSELHVPVGDRGVFLVGSTTVDNISANERKLLDIVITHVQTALRLVDRRSQLEQAREQAEAEREQLRQVIDAVPQFIFAKNDAGEFIFANEAVAEAYGTTPSDLEGKTDADFAPNDADVEVFTEDDRTVIETGEPVYRYGETLTDVDGNERILETQKVPFDPVGTDGRAVLGSSTDVTELERTQTALNRLQRLNSLYKLESELRHCRTPAEIHEAGTDAVFEGLDDVVVATYSYREDDGALHRVTTAPADGDQFPETVTVDDGAYWRAFTADQIQELDDATGRRGYAVPIGSAGLLTVAETDDTSEDVSEFLRSIGDALASAIERSEQGDSAKELRANLDRLETELDATSVRLGAVAETIERVLEAESRAELDRALIGFIDTNWEYGWVGDYKPQKQAVVPNAVTDDDGPAAELRDGSIGVNPPALEAATTRSHVYTDRTLAERDKEWAKTMLAYGYHSVLSVPIADRGIIYGVVEIASVDVDAFDTNDISTVRSLCRTVARRLRQLSTGSSTRQTIDTVEVDIAFSDTRPLFPSLPDDVSIRVQRVVTVDSPERRLQLIADGLFGFELEMYFSKTPGFTDSYVRETPTALMAEVSLDVTRRDPTEMFFNEIAVEDARVSGVVAGPDSEIITVTAEDGSSVSAVVDALTDRFEGATPVAKRVEGHSRTGLFDPLELLTDRQREILRTAYNEGYYDQPKGINGQQLAEMFDISHSTVHEHLSAAERKIMQTAFGEDIANPDSN